MKLFQLKNAVVLFVLLFQTNIFIRAQIISNILETKFSNNELIFKCNDNLSLKLTILRDDIVRIQIGKNAQFEPALNTELGFVLLNKAAVPKIKSNNANELIATTTKFDMKVNKNPFNIQLFDKQEQLITSLSDKSSIVVDATGNKLNFKMGEDEHFYGFGFLRTVFDARGEKLTWERGYRWKEATLPFFVSTRNYAFLSNNTYSHYFDFTLSENDKKQKNEYSIQAKDGSIDFYVLVNNSMKDLLNT